MNDCELVKVFRKSPHTSTANTPLQKPHIKKQDKHFYSTNRKTESMLLLLAFPIQSDGIYFILRRKQTQSSRRIHPGIPEKSDIKIQFIDRFCGKLFSKKSVHQPGGMTMTNQICQKSFHVIRPDAIHTYMYSEARSERDLCLHTTENEWKALQHNVENCVLSLPLKRRVRIKGAHFFKCIKFSFDSNSI